MKCMFDTVIFNRVLDESEPIERLTECVAVYSTHIQRDEINNTQDEERRRKLNRVFADLNPEMRSTKSAVWNVSKWNQARWSEGDNLLRTIETKLDEHEKKKNNIRDALIAETAIKNKYTLVTDDGDLRDVAAELGANCMTFKELLQHCQK